jgi:hypothetical protein
MQSGTLNPFPQGRTYQGRLQESLQQPTRTSPK